jgi:DNA-binding NarL/FixJ family response regulator
MRHPWSIVPTWTNREIAEELYVSVRTIDRYLANIYAKTGVRGRANATSYALTHLI